MVACILQSVERRELIKLFIATELSIGSAMKRLNVPISIRIFRSIRRASRIAIGISAFFFLISFEQISVATFELAIPVVISILVYLSALAIGQALANREFAAALTFNSGTDRPIVLFLRSFGVARSSLPSRFIAELGHIVQFGFAIAGLYHSRHLPPYRHNEVEEDLDNALGVNVMFVALGDRLASFGAAKLTVKDEDWQSMFHQLANASQLIFMMPGLSAGTLWELFQISCSHCLREKTVFIMPPRGFPLVRSSPQWEWAALSDMVAELGVRFPPYSPEGCFFRLREDSQPTDIVGLEPFTLALSKFVTSPAYAGAIDFANVSKLVGSARSTNLGSRAGPH